jgi:thioredoxin reductase (NADPH)
LIPHRVDLRDVPREIIDMNVLTDSLPPTESPDVYGAYPRLGDDQIAGLAGAGQRRPVKPGDVLYREGDGDCDFFVIL